MKIFYGIFLAGSLIASCAIAMDDKQAEELRAAQQSPAYPSWGNEKPLFKAVYTQNLAEVKRLLALGNQPLNAFEEGLMGKSPLMVAAGKANPEVADVLLQAGADANLAMPTFKKTALMEAVTSTNAKDMIATVKVLVTGGAKVRTTDSAQLNVGSLMVYTTATNGETVTNVIPLLNIFLGSDSTCVPQDPFGVDDVKSVLFHVMENLWDGNELPTSSSKDNQPIGAAMKKLLEAAKEQRATNH